MNRQLKIADLKRLSDVVSVKPFDRSVLEQQTMHDNALAEEILGLFLAQIDRLDKADWDKLELAFEMHTLRGAAAVVGAMQIAALADGWRRQGSSLERKLKAALADFRAAAKQG